MPGRLRRGRAHRSGRSALKGRARPGPAPAAAVPRRGRGEEGRSPPGQSPSPRLVTSRAPATAGARAVERPEGEGRERLRARAALGASCVRADAPPRPSPVPRLSHREQRERDCCALGARDCGHLEMRGLRSFAAAAMDVEPRCLRGQRGPRPQNLLSIFRLH